MPDYVVIINYRTLLQRIVERCIKIDAIVMPLLAIGVSWNAISVFHGTTIGAAWNYYRSSSLYVVRSRLRELPGEGRGVGGRRSSAGAFAASSSGWGARSASWRSTTPPRSVGSRFRAHHRCESRCRDPCSGNEKGSVENAVGFLRRNLLAPVPEAASPEELNERIGAGCDRINAGARSRSSAATAEALGEDPAGMSALSGAPFDEVLTTRSARGRQPLLRRPGAARPDKSSTSPATSRPSARAGTPRSA